MGKVLLALPFVVSVLVPVVMVASQGSAHAQLPSVPVSVPVNLCGNTVSVVGVLNPAFGNFCINK